MTPHPFDAHPPLAARLENVGEALAPTDVVQLLLEPTHDSWVSTIQDAEAIEARLWGEYEQQFVEEHRLALAYRYVPNNEAERQHVEEHFPPLTFEGQEEGLKVSLDFAQVRCSEWDEPVHLGQEKSATTKDRMFKKYLDLQVEGRGLFKGKRAICLSKLYDPDGMLRAFGHYLGRHRTLQAYQQRSQKAA